MSGIMMGTLKETTWARANAIVIDRCPNPDVTEESLREIADFLDREAMPIDALKSICDYFVGRTRQGTDLTFFENRKADHMADPENARFYITVVDHIIRRVRVREPYVTATRILQNTNNYPEFDTAVEALTARIANASCLGIYSIHNCVKYVEEMTRIQTDIDDELTNLKNGTTENVLNLFKKRTFGYMQRRTKVVL